MDSIGLHVSRLAKTATALFVAAIVFASAAPAAALPHHRPARTAPKPETVTITTPANPCPDVTIPAVALDPALRAAGPEITTIQADLGVATDSVYGPITAGAVNAIPGIANAYVGDLELDLPACLPITAGADARPLLADLQALADATDRLTAEARARRPVARSGSSLKANCADPSVQATINAAFAGTGQEGHALQVASNESGCTDTALNGQGSGAAGLFQLLGHQDLLDQVCPGVPDNWANASCNAQAARILYDGGGWSPWSSSGG
jgi:hypothetical protein